MLTEPTPDFASQAASPMAPIRFYFQSQPLLLILFLYSYAQFITGLELLDKYGVTPETFVNCWLGFSTTKLDGQGPSLETLLMFDKDVLSKESFAKTKIKKEPQSDSPVIHNITTFSQL